MKTFQRSASPGGWKGAKKTSAPGTWKRGGFGGGRDGAPMELHPATCNECGDRCEVPFKPNGRKPVLCGKCFKKDVPPYAGASGKPPYVSKPWDKKPERAWGNKSERATWDEKRAPNRELDEVKQQLRVVNDKLDALLELLSGGEEDET